VNIPLTKASRFSRRREKINPVQLKNVVLTDRAPQTWSPIANPLFQQLVL